MHWYRDTIASAEIYYSSRLWISTVFSGALVKVVRSNDSKGVHKAQENWKTVMLFIPNIRLTARCHRYNYLWISHDNANISTMLTCILSRSKIFFLSSISQTNGQRGQWLKRHVGDKNMIFNTKKLLTGAWIADKVPCFCKCGV